MLWLLPPLAVAGYLLWRKKNADSLTNEYDSSGQPQPKPESGFTAEPPKADMALAPEAAPAFVDEAAKNAPLMAPTAKAGAKQMVAKAISAKPSLQSALAIRAARARAALPKIK